MQGIMFKEDMFKAIIDGRKTQTRRTGGLDLVNIDPDYEIHFECMEKDPDVCRLDKDGDIVLDKWDEPKLKTLKGWYGLFEGPFGEFDARYLRPKYQPGQVLYLKEPYRVIGDVGDIYDTGVIARMYAYDSVVRRKTYDDWLSKMFMPANLARYFIKITKVDTQRVQDISEEDAIAEGVLDAENMHAIGFGQLWMRINGTVSWNKNPWVWIYHFVLTDKPKNGF